MPLLALLARRKQDNQNKQCGLLRLIQPDVAPVEHCNGYLLPSLSDHCVQKPVPATNVAATPLRQLRAKLGHMRSSQQLQSNIDTQKLEYGQRISTAVWGRWGSCIQQQRYSDNQAVFHTQDGVQLHNYTTSVHRQSTRMRAVGLYSFVKAQSSAIIQFFKRSPVAHALVLQTADDTNVWVRATHVGKKTTRDEDGDEDSDGQVTANAKDHSSKKVVQNLLGIIQHLVLRRVCSTRTQLSESAQVHQPSQILPKGNAATIRDRMARWGLLSSTGSSEQLGGEMLRNQFARTKVNGIVSAP